MVAIRWSQLGFGKTSSTTPDAPTPRNLMGFKDGTRNIAGTDAAARPACGRGRRTGRAWMAGGSYLVARRIRMHIETWDRTSLQEQEEIFGRDKGEGAPLGGKASATRRLRRPYPRRRRCRRRARPPRAPRLQRRGADLLRRGYSFTDGTDGLGRLDAGLFFLAYQRDPRRRSSPCRRSWPPRRAQRVHPARGFGLFAVPRA